jgi:hypothetical protein
MRRVLVLVAAVAAVVTLAACEPTPPPTPTVGISMALSGGTCTAGSDVTVKGSLDEGVKTPKVTVQRTVGGKWVDLKWYRTSDTGEQAGAITATVDSGSKFRTTFVQEYYGQKLPGTIHLRVRSAGGTVISNDRYLTFETSCAG